MKYQLLTLCLVVGLAHAEGARIGLEIESEKNQKTGMTNHALALAPGWEFAEKNLINRIELMFETNQDSQAGSDGVREKEKKLTFRVRHNGELSEKLDYFIRAGLSRSFNDQRSFNLAYIEPGLEYKLNPQWAWTLALRKGNAIDASAGQRVEKLITGPSVELNKYSEIELRYVKSSGDKDSTAWVLEYVHKY